MPQHRSVIRFCPLPKKTKIHLMNWLDFPSNNQINHGRTAILQTGQQLYDEISCQLYHRELRLRYSLDSKGMFRRWSAEGLPSGDILNFCRTFVYADFARFERIVFEIGCVPERIYRDVGLYLLLRDIIPTISDITQCRVDALRGLGSSPARSANLPRIEIVFLDPVYREEDMDLVGQIMDSSVTSATHIEGCMNGLAHLRSTDEVTIELSNDSRDNKHLAEVAEKVKRSMMTGYPRFPALELPEHPPGHCLEGGFSLRNPNLRSWYLYTLQEKIRGDLRPLRSSTI